MRLYSIAVLFQASHLMANHPDCGKQARERVGSDGVQHSTGVESSILQQPWAIAILLSDEFHCSGSILSENYVLTAAHCFHLLDETKMTIIAGSDDPANSIPEKKRNLVQKKKIDSVKIHPLYENPAARHDLALVKIKGRFTFRNSRWPICIPEETRSREFHFSRGYSLVGFGRDLNLDNRGSVLTTLDLDVQPTVACSSEYARILNDERNDQHLRLKNTLPKNFDEDSLLCASKPGRSSGSCPGDSGGIFMRNEYVSDLNDYRNIQTAVVHGAVQKCNGGRYPPIFVRIDTDEALPWINSIAFPITQPATTPKTPAYRAIGSTNCGRHRADSCKDCGSRSRCNGDCEWNFDSNICGPKSGFTIKRGSGWLNVEGNIDTLKEVTGSNTNACIQECNKTPGCVGFTFVSSIDRCDLKTDDQAVKLDYSNSDAIISGTLKLRPGAGWHNSRGSINSMAEVGAENASQCEKPCRDTSGCVGWTYVKGPKRCDLKSEDDAVSYDFSFAGVVSGLI